MPIHFSIATRDGPTLPCSPTASAIRIPVDRQMYIERPTESSRTYRYPCIRLVKHCNQHIQSHQNSYNVEHTEYRNACIPYNSVFFFVNLKTITVYLAEQ